MKSPRALASWTVLGAVATRDPEQAVLAMNLTLGVLHLRVGGSSSVQWQADALGGGAIALCGWSPRQAFDLDRGCAVMTPPVHERRLTAFEACGFAQHLLELGEDHVWSEELAEMFDGWLAEQSARAA